MTLARKQAPEPKRPEIDMTEEPIESDPLILSAETVGEYLVARNVFPSLDGMRVEELGGGVSNVVLAVSRDAVRVVVKQALPRLRVPDEWLAKRERAINEGQALRLADMLVPNAVPGLIDIDHDRCALTITAVPDGSTTWKSRLLAGDADPSVAARLGEVLAALHRGTFQDEQVASAFGDLEAFDQLRVDPYYRTVARRRPELAEAIDAFAARMCATHLCLVHGDYSPKNVLVGGDLWVIDFEVSHFGDPVFDVAFMLNHLLLKRIHVRASRSALEECARRFWEAYRIAVPEELAPDMQYVLGHVGCLMVARVDGKSPAEYLSPDERDISRALGSRLLLAPPESLEAAFGLGESVLA